MYLHTTRTCIMYNEVYLDSHIRFLLFFFFIIKIEHQLGGWQQQQEKKKQKALNTIR